MTVTVSPDTQASLLSRVLAVTGQPLAHWLRCLDDGPGLVRAEERAGWLRDVHALPHAFAVAVVRAHDAQRRSRRD